MPLKALIFVPTFNERENAPRMCEDLHKVGVDADVLFMDDNSPDGTGTLASRGSSLGIRAGCPCRHRKARNWERPR